ncbi:MAG: PLDc N-terminal domain-containing protein [Jiangellaceae bacterium]
MRLALPIVVAVVLAVFAMIECVQADPAQVRSLRKPLWLVVIVLVPVIGPIFWLVIGRPRARRLPTASPPRPVAPDDDPEFLRLLRDADLGHEKMLDDWEADLRRREDELRRRTDGDDEPS